MGCPRLLIGSRVWVLGVLMSDQGTPGSEAAEIDHLCDEFEKAWVAGERPRIEDYLERISAKRRVGLFRELWRLEMELRRKQGEQPRLLEYFQRFSDFAEVILEKTYISEATIGDQVGRYQLRKVLGQGAFGRVYLAVDQELRRQVAVKVPLAERFQQPEDAEIYLDEARTVARLDHPHIVPVHDVGRTEDGSVYIVSKFIKGRALSEAVRHRDFDPSTAASLLTPIAEALHYAHEKQLIHRDVKPGNILIEEATGKPYLTDFGLAIREEDALQTRTLAGTPAYMSPEQARGEGHLLDQRSDIFSLGVVFYELLTATHPFPGLNTVEVLHKVQTLDPPPPGQLNPAVPWELERICLKALAKRLADRYDSAAGLVEDLLVWRQGPVQQPQDQPIVPRGLRAFQAEDADFFLTLLPGPHARDGLPESIHFWKQHLEQTECEKTFKIGLLYGPSGCGKSSLIKAGLLPKLGNDILPIYLEATPEATETRLLLTLRRHFPELPGDWGLLQTLTELRRHRHRQARRDRRQHGSEHPGVDSTVHQVSPSAQTEHVSHQGQEYRKVVIVLDQFEQWLHVHRCGQQTELVSALRQCDGGALQAVVMVRDDFAMAASRFMGEVESAIVQGHNFATVDLFALDHAEKVLAKFGQAFGRLPAQSSQFSSQQQEFLTAAVAGLAEGGQVVPVRIALFAEMVKAQPWVPATLTAVGGTQGIGVNFLEETFSSRHANPDHRRHQQAARHVLGALLPAGAAQIRGHRKAYAELLEASGYRSPTQFDQLLRILDRDLRLITPADSEDSPEDLLEDVPGDAHRASQSSAGHYQLTHDYLVPSLREWLQRKQRETRTGRAEVTLEERSALWRSQPEHRHLPSLGEWVGICRWTDANRWTCDQRKMMRQAGRVYFSQTAIWLLLLVSLAIGAYGISSWVHARGLLNSLLIAKPGAVLGAAEQVAAYRWWTESRLTRITAQPPQTPEDRRRALHARLALIHHDPTQVQPLKEVLLNVEDWQYFREIREALGPFQDEISSELWNSLHDASSSGGDSRRFRAALALAAYEPQATQWTVADQRFIVEQLVAENPVHQPALWALLDNLGGRLISPLQAVFSDPRRSDVQQVAAAGALAEFGGQDAELMADLLAQASPEQYRILYRRFVQLTAADKLGPLWSVLRQQRTFSLPKERISWQQQRVGAAVTLLRQGKHQAVFEVLRVDDDLESLTQCVHRCRSRGVKVPQLLECLEVADRQRQKSSAKQRQQWDRIVYGLLLALGEFPLERVPPGQRDWWINQLADWYRNDPSSAIHGASGWLLRHWGFDELVQKVDQTPIPYDETGKREWFVLAIDPGMDPRPGQHAQGRHLLCFTFIVFKPGMYQVGSAADEPGREKDERRRQVTIQRSFAVLDREVTWAQFNVFDGAQRFTDTERRDPRSQQKPPEDGPVYFVNWFEAVAYCRWLTRQHGFTEAEQFYKSDPLEGVNSPHWFELPDATVWPVNQNRQGFRLPSEDEWEIMCRGGTTTMYSFGSDTNLLERYAWFLDNSKNWSHPTAQLRPNVRGFFDTHGNVYEWCEDWYRVHKHRTFDPAEPADSLKRVRRGGSCVHRAAACRSSNSHQLPASERGDAYGFRLAITLPNPTQH